MEKKKDETPLEKTERTAKEIENDALIIRRGGVVESIKKPGDKVAIYAAPEVIEQLDYLAGLAGTNRRLFFETVIMNIRPEYASRLFEAYRRKQENNNEVTDIL